MKNSHSCAVVNNTKQHNIEKSVHYWTIPLLKTQENIFSYHITKKLLKWYCSVHHSLQKSPEIVRSHQKSPNLARNHQKSSEFSRNRQKSCPFLTSVFVWIFLEPTRQKYRSPKLPFTVHRNQNFDINWTKLPPFDPTRNFLQNTPSNIDIHSNHNYLPNHRQLWSRQNLNTLNDEISKVMLTLTKFHSPD